MNLSPRMNLSPPGDLVITTYIISISLIKLCFALTAHCCHLSPDGVMTAVKLLRDVGGVTDAAAGMPALSKEAMGTGYVFTVDNLLKMLSITLRLQV